MGNRRNAYRPPSHGTAEEMSRREFLQANLAIAGGALLTLGTGGTLDEVLLKEPAKEPAVEPAKVELSKQEADRLYQESQARGYEWGGHENGRIPSDAMEHLPGGHHLEKEAAHDWNRMVAAAREDGVIITLTDSYRSYEGQVLVRKEKGDKVATAPPGTSIHGWGRAVDVDDGREWIQENGYKYGWIWPEWAQAEGTKKYEPWHFEYVWGSK